MKTTAFKNTDIGPIPEDWEVKKIANIAPLQRGFDLPTTSIEDGPYPVVYSNGILAHHTIGPCKAPGIITGRSGTIGSFLFVENGRYWPHNTTLWVTSFCGNDPKFVFYLYSHIGFDRFSGGTGVPTLNRNDVHVFKTAIPPSVSEQRRIAAALSDADELVASLDKLIEKKKRVKEGAMQRLLSGETRLLGFGSTAFNQTELGPIPSDWEVKRLGEVCDIRTGKRNGDEQTELGLYPFFVRSNTVYRINSYSYEGEAILVPGEGGIGEIFHYINGRFDYHQRVYKISDFKKGVFAQFVYYFMRRYFGNWAKAQTVKATVDSLRLPTFEQFILLLPDFHEQRAIAAVLSDMDAEIAALSRERAEAERIKQGMMQELLTGKVRLT